MLTKKTTLIALAVIACGLTLYVGIERIGKDVTRTHDLARGGLLAYAAELNIASNYVPHGRAFRGRGFGNKLVCANRGTQNWFKNTNVDECRFTWSTAQANDHCSWWRVGETCVGFVVPQVLFADSSFRKALLSATEQPCAAFYDRKIDKRADVYSALSCSEGREHRKFEVYIVVVRQNWDDFQSFEELDHNADVVDTIRIPSKSS